MTSGASTTRLQALAPKPSLRNWSVINVSLLWHKNENFSQKPMASDQNTVRTLYKRLIAFYPKALREQLRESMEQTFEDLCKERQREAGWFGFFLWMFIETSMGIVQERILLIREMNPMKII